MRSQTWVAVLIAAAAGTAAADVATKRITLPIDPATVPDRCRIFTEMPADSRGELVPWNQRLSLAACMKPVELVGMATLHGITVVVSRIDYAMEPARKLYGDAIARAPDQIRLMAWYGLGKTYVDTMVRARRTVDAAEYGGATYGGRITAHWSLEWYLVAPKLAAVNAFREVVKMADRDPALATTNAVITNAVADSRTMLGLFDAPETETSPVQAAR